VGIVALHEETLLHIQAPMGHAMSQVKLGLSGGNDSRRLAPGLAWQAHMKSAGVIRRLTGLRSLRIIVVRLERCLGTRSLRWGIPGEMSGKIRRHVERCLEEFSAGRLTEAGLRGVLDALDATPPRQQLLFLRVDGLTISSSVVGMMMLKNGEIDQGPLDPEEWPHKTVIDAIQNGWRVIKFPELALWVDETRTYEVGGEFVLEKWSET